MKKILALSLALCLLASLGSFAFADESAATVQTICDRVIEVTYASFDFEKGAEYLSKYDPEMGGCSAVRVLVGDKVYVGRNYDFYCSDSPAFIVRNNAGKIRTIGIGNSPDSLGTWTEGYELSETILGALPHLCCDVMSEAGLYAETNIREYEEALTCSSTNPGAPRRCTQVFMQYMLSNYATIDEILAHVDDFDWFDLGKMGFEQAFFITDQSGRSVIIEFAANSWKWHEAEYNSNFFVDNDYYAIEQYPVGEQRTSRELAYKPFVRTEDDIFTMMEQGAYAQFYTNTVELEYALPEFASDVGYNRFDPSTYEPAIEKLKALLDEYATYTWEDMIANRCWESTFITAANVTDLTLNVHFSEHYGIRFTVSFED